MTQRRSRKRLAKAPYLLLLAIGLLASVAWFAWPRVGAEPQHADGVGAGQLVAAQPVVNLGTVPFDKLVEARFELTNAGQGSVRLTGKPDVTTLEGCWPVTPAVSSTVIQPGQTMTVRYPFIMHPGMGGPHRFEIRLATDSAQQPIVTLTLVAVAGS